MNNYDWNIRKAVTKDAKNLKTCMEEAYAIYVSRLEGQRLPPMDIDYVTEIEMYPVWVVEYEEQIVGGLILQFEDAYAKLANIAIRPDFQGKGLGERLMTFAENEAIKRGYKEMKLATHEKLSENVLYYQRLGWEETERDEMRVYMKKPLVG
ncbi:GNAT family N-acetyltransferase [Bacillus sp. 2205SS5-2]|uniref:GNAT family N-acetyltransferase n=1 Tax=Bacillus sp. 2205SS5-2 TaxID=3109031 RepID=UPI003006FD13